MAHVKNPGKACLTVNFRSLSVVKFDWMPGSGRLTRDHDLRSYLQLCTWSLGSLGFFPAGYFHFPDPYRSLGVCRALLEYVDFEVKLSFH